MSWLGVKWAYGPATDRTGPFSTKEIRDLIQKGIITPETLLSEYHAKPGRRSEPDYPAIKTEFSVYFPDETFTAATKYDQVPDYWMWTAVFIPLLLAIVVYFVYFSGREPISPGIGGVLIGAGFMYADCSLMIKRGYKPPFREITYSIFFAPMVYFYYRSKQLKRRQTPAWMSAACLLLIVGMADAWPMFDNKDVEEIGARIFNAILQPMRPEVTAQCVSASVEKRLPGMKFRVVGHLSDGEEMKMTLVQSWRRLTLYSKDGMVDILLPNDIAAVFITRMENLP